MPLPIPEVERLLITLYRKDLWRPFTKAIEEYRLIAKGDRLAVCISGGKDSLTLAKLMQELNRHGKIAFEPIFLVMDPGYQNDDLSRLQQNALALGIPIEIIASDIFEVTRKIAKEYPCYLCARMRRGTLYQLAQARGCNKIVLGHHFDDAIETILLNVLYGGTYKGMMPKAKSQNFPGMELIRPMIYIKEAAITRFIKKIDIQAMDCGCPGGELPSKRKEIKTLIANLRTVYRNVDISIYRSSQNVNIDCVLGYQKDNVAHSFLDEYDKND